MKVSVIIPAYNEQNTVGVILSRVLALPFEKEVIVVDDGSTDGTGVQLEKFAGERCLRVFRHEKNSGKGFAVITGLKNASGEVVVIQDADMEYSPEEIPKMLRAIENGADAVYGSRLKGTMTGMTLTHLVGNVALTLAARILYGSGLSDMETGYKMFRRGVVKWETLKSKNFEIEPEITARIIKAGHRIEEVPITYSGRPKKEKKIGVKDGFIALAWLVKCRFERG